MKNALILFVALFISVSSSAQGLGINYKAVIKDDIGNAVSSQAIKVRLSVLDSTLGIVYQETHDATTDASGIIILSIGWGDNVIGSYWDIEWGDDFYSLRTEVDTLPFDNYVAFPDEFFSSVPYAYHAIKAYSAETADNITTKLDQLSDAKSDDDGSNNGSSVFLGIGSGLTDDGTNNRNVGVGFQTLQANTFGYNNVANGHSALKVNTEGHSNIAVGANTLTANTTGHGNTAIGSNTLAANTNGHDNTATGIEALRFNTTGTYNTANGGWALRDNITGFGHTASGYFALEKNLGGIASCAFGLSALQNNTTGSYNTAMGYGALSNVSTGSNNIGIGNGAEAAIGSNSNQIRIGNANISIASIQVGWTVTSDKRWKKNIRQLPYGIDMVMQLNPVDYTRKNQDKQTREMGFIAQDLETLLTKIDYTDQGFLTKDDKGFLSVRYNDFIALLTKAIQEQQSIIDEQKTHIDNISADNSSLKNTVSNLISRVEKIEANNQ